MLNREAVIAKVYATLSKKDKVLAEEFLVLASKYKWFIQTKYKNPIAKGELSVEDIDAIIMADQGDQELGYLPSKKVGEDYKLGTLATHYADWLIERFLKEEYRIEDLPAAYDDLKIFHKEKLYANKQVMSMSRRDMEKLVEETSKSEESFKEKGVREDINPAAKYKIVFKGSQHEVIVPENKEAAIYFTNYATERRGDMQKDESLARWCFGDPDEGRNVFNSYQAGNIYIVRTMPKHNPLYAIYFGTDIGSFQCKDRFDQEQPIENLLDKDNALNEFFLDKVEELAKNEDEQMMMYFKFFDRYPEGE